MKIRIAVTAACLAAAGALLAGPATLANAATVQPHHAVSASVTTIPLHLTAGSRTVSVTIPLTAARAAAPGASSGITGQGYADIRVGKNNCGGYKGTIYWAPTFIQATGTLWDNCNYYTPNTTVYLYVSFSNVSGGGNLNMASVTGVQNSKDIGGPSKGIFGSPSNVYADACLQWNNGWGCGPKSPRL